MKTADEILHEHDIAPPPPGKHRYYTTCPQCSANRSRAHQKAACLGVTVKGDGVKWGCNHCLWTGGGYYNGKINGPGGEPTTTYDYRDEQENLLSQKVRNPPGDAQRFWQRRPDGRGGWINNTQGVRKVLYRLPEVLEAIASGRIILVVEGKKDVDSLWRIGIPATCSPDGASDIGKTAKWRMAYSESLGGADLVVIPDHDAAGYAHASATAKASVSVAKRVRMLTLAKHWPECPKGGDVNDWLAAGHTREQLDALIDRAPDHGSVGGRPRGATWDNRNSPEPPEVQTFPDNPTSGAASDVHDPAASDERGEKPRLLVDNCNPDQTVAALRDLLADARGLYDRGVPVRLAFDQNQRGTVAEMMTPDALVLMAHSICRPYVLKAGQDGTVAEVNARLPRSLAVMYLDWRGEWRLPPLNGIASAPLLQDDGTVRSAAGYDLTSGMWCENVPKLTGLVPERPTKDAAAAALCLIRETFKTFCFADAETIEPTAGGVATIDTSKTPGRDEASFLVALLTAVCRPSLTLPRVCCCGPRPCRVRVPARACSPLHLHHCLRAGAARRDGRCERGRVGEADCRRAD